MITTAKEPTSDECSKNYVISRKPGEVTFAAWYPQMGGYVSRCIVKSFTGDSNNCFEVYVWHDGEFPFDDESSPGKPPAHIHHCNADQFIEFGKQVLQMQEAKT